MRGGWTWKWWCRLGKCLRGRLLKTGSCNSRTIWALRTVSNVSEGPDTDHLTAVDSVYYQCMLILSFYLGKIDLVWRHAFPLLENISNWLNISVRAEILPWLPTVSLRLFSQIDTRSNPQDRLAYCPLFSFAGQATSEASVDYIRICQLTPNWYTIIWYLISSASEAFPPPSVAPQACFFLIENYQLLESKFDCTLNFEKFENHFKTYKLWIYSYSSFIWFSFASTVEQNRQRVAFHFHYGS